MLGADLNPYAYVQGGTFGSVDPDGLQDAGPAYPGEPSDAPDTSIQTTEMEALEAGAAAEARQGFAEKGGERGCIGNECVIWDRDATREATERISKQIWQAQ